ncbi:MAG: TetR/AcrR family transcriptional regulator [Dermatophilus congolensis]|nr:TetR/AcrR family transcriptional regulator [Dermatophilus congolensis]
MSQQNQGSSPAVRMPRSQRREQLLRHARDVFVESGYHSASMDDIAERAGVSKPVLYQHFPGKLELYLDLLDEAIAQVRALVVQALEQPLQGDDLVRATVDAYFGFVSADGGAFRLVFESDLTNEPESTNRVRALHMECAKAIADKLREFTELSEQESQLAAIGIVGMAQVSARAWFTVGTQPKEKAVDVITALAWRGLRGFIPDDTAQALKLDD